MGDPGPSDGADDRLDGRHHPAGRSKHLDPLRHTLVHDRLPVGHHDELRSRGYPGDDFCELIGPHSGLSAFSSRTFSEPRSLRRILKPHHWTAFRPPASHSSYDARLISKYIFDARLATLVRCAAFVTSRATAGATFLLKTDGMMYSSDSSSFPTQEAMA